MHYADYRSTCLASNMRMPVAATAPPVKSAPGCNCDCDSPLAVLSVVCGAVLPAPSAQLQTCLALPLAAASACRACGPGCRRCHCLHPRPQRAHRCCWCLGHPRPHPWLPHCLHPHRKVLSLLHRCCWRCLQAVCHRHGHVLCLTHLAAAACLQLQDCCRTFRTHAQQQCSQHNPGHPSCQMQSLPHLKMG